MKRKAKNPRQKKKVVASGKVKRGRTTRNPGINFREYSRTAFLNPRKISPAQVRAGTKVEMEHTKSRKVARKIAMDHLRETPNYYTRLRKCFPEEHHNPKVTLVDPRGVESFGINARRNPSKDREAKKTYMSKGYAHKVYIPNWKRVIDPRSIRTRVIRTKKGGKRLIRFGCPKGEWMPKAKRCKVGTRAISILTPKSEKIPTAREYALFAAGNPPRLGGKSGLLFPLARCGREITANPFRGTEAERKRLVSLGDKLEREATRKGRKLWSYSDLSKKEREEYERLLSKVEIQRYPRSVRKTAPALPYTGEEFLRVASARGYKNPGRRRLGHNDEREIEYTPGMRIRNLQALPRGLGAKYLIVIPAPQSDPGAWVAKAWARAKPVLTGIEHLMILKR